MNETKRIGVKVAVGKEIREYIISATGSDVLSPGRRTILWSLIRPWLTSSPDPAAVRDPEQDITILLRMKESNRIYSFAADSVRYINTCWSDFYLTREGEAAVRRHFEASFRHMFHTYMAGYRAAGMGLEVLDGITSFCLDYGITVTEVLIQRLDKDWYRYRKKVGEDAVCPFLF